MGFQHPETPAYSAADAFHALSCVAEFHSGYISLTVR
jgi:hypothetical protein